VIKKNKYYINIGQQTEVWIGSSKVSLPPRIQPRMHPRWRHGGLEEHMRLSADLILQAHYWNDAVWHLKESLALQKTHQHYKRERGMHSTHEHRSKPAITAYRIHTHTHTVHYAGILPMDPIRISNSCLWELFINQTQPFKIWQRKRLYL